MTAALPEELLEEIFLRLPPDEPEWLLCASLASKLWLGLLSGPSFRGRYRDLHGAPPMLGFLYSLYLRSGEKDEQHAPNLVPTTKFRPRVPDGGWRSWRYTPLDCRHGRVLLAAEDVIPEPLIIWDPMTGCQRELDTPFKTDRNHRATVLCAASGCDHRDCHDGRFQVVFVGLCGTEDSSYARACVFSSETGEWGKQCSSLYLDDETLIEPIPPVLIEDALFFMCAHDRTAKLGIIKYDLGSNRLSLIDSLVGHAPLGAAILMAKEDGCLGFARVDGLTLYLWSRQIMDSDKVASWTVKPRVVNLKNLLPTQSPMENVYLGGSVQGSDIIFVTTDLGVYEVNLKSVQCKKNWRREEYFNSLIPYVSFYHPQGRVSTCDVAH
ncbi:unnamed protein product [Alopecurus aequalis]